MFYVRFEEIFNMLHLRRLDSSLLSLWVLHLVTAIRTDNVQDIAIADPYLMHEGNLKSANGRRKMQTYIGDFMFANQDKTSILMPYCP